MMRRTLLLALLLAGCDATPQNASTTMAINDIAATNTLADDQTATEPSNAAPDNGTTSATPAPDSAEAAADVVRHYYALVEAGNYADAWQLWDPAPPGQTQSGFAASFAQYSEYHAQVGKPGEVDAGAGQRYVTVPVTLSRRLKTGVDDHATVAVTLHRVGDIDGATPAQRTWHIRSIDAQPTG